MGGLREIFLSDTTDKRKRRLLDLCAAAFSLATLMKIDFFFLF